MSALHGRLPSHCQKVLCKNRGFNLGGPIPRCPDFKTKRTSTTASMSDLHVHSQTADKAIIESTVSSGNAVTDAETYAATVQEAECGWLSGPMDPSSISAALVTVKPFLPLAMRNSVLQRTTRGTCCLAKTESTRQQRLWI